MNRGFTLIELLVSISIIGVLASIVLVSLNGVRDKGRDALRVATLEELRKGVEIFYLEHGYIPLNAGWISCASYTQNGTNHDTSDQDDDLMETLITAGIFGGRPVDPLSDNDGNCSGGGVLTNAPQFMYYRGGGSGGTIGPDADRDYCVYANLEQPTPAQEATMKVYRSSDNLPSQYGMNYAVCSS